MQFVTETFINGGGTTFQKIQHDYCNVGSLGSLGYLCVNISLFVIHVKIDYTCIVNLCKGMLWNVLKFQHFNTQHL